MIIIGKIIDKISNQPLSYVNIVVKENNKLVTGGITTEKGNFVIKNLVLKNYTVEKNSKCRSKIDIIMQKN